MVFTPESEELVSTFCLEIALIKEHNGAGLATQIDSIVKRFMSPSQVTCFCFDGQYFKLGVDKELKTMGYQSANFEWDAAHRLQLAENDFRQGRKQEPKVTKLSWLEKSLACISAVISEVNFGKSLDIFWDIAEDSKIDILSLKGYSTTRFAPYVSRVFSALLRDFKPVVLTLEQIGSSCGEVKKRERCKFAATNMKTFSFLGTLLLLDDFYNVWGILSAELQIVNSLPHQRIASVEKTVQKLKEMAKIIDLDGKVDFDKLKMWKSLLQLPVHISTFEYYGLPLSLGKGIGDQSILEFVCSRASELCSRAVSAINFRFPELSQPESWCSTFIGELTNAYCGSSYNTASYTEKLRECDECCVDQAESLLIRVSCDQIARKNKTAETCLRNKLEVEALKEIFTRPDYYNNRSALLRHLAQYIMAVSVESVVESIGSILRHRSNCHELSMEALNEEVKIGWQGPSIPLCGGLMKKAFNIHFGGPDKWNFTNIDDGANSNIQARLWSGCPQTSQNIHSLTSKFSSAQ